MIRGLLTGANKAFADVKRLNRQDWIRYLKSPRCIFALILTFCILSITFTHVPGQSFFWTSETTKCSSKFVEKYTSLEQIGAIKIFKDFESPDVEKNSDVILGNGHVMLSAFDPTDVSITYQDNRHVIPFDMSWDIEIENSKERLGNAYIDYRTGVLTKSTCHGVFDNCLHVSHKMLVHRSQPNLFLQTMRFTWTGFHLHEVEILINPPTPKSTIKNVKTTEKTEEYTYRIASGLYAAIITEILPESFLLKGDEKTKLLSQKIVFGMAKTSESALEVARKNMKAAQEQSDLKLIEDHEQAWKDLLHTGIHLDPDDPDPHHIIPRAQLVNSTVHSIMAVTPSKTQSQALGEDYQLIPNAPIMTPDYCYNGVATLHSNSLWKDVLTIDEAFALRDSWQLTLKNHGCSGLVYAGAEGLLQAMVLSFAGLQFTSEHLALGTDPEVLHNEIGLSNIRYKNSSIDIYLIKEDGIELPEIHVTARKLSKFAEKIYACEAGCMLQIEPISAEDMKFPIFVTKPATPILYISHSREHLDLLQHTLHVESKISHAEHYSSHSSGISVYFWYFFGAFFFLFHFCLIRLVLKEYWSWGSTPQQYSYRFRLQP
ncbi:Oidioi.mRNA.OKI2018_I69.PAR.g11963.t1.cds [Oikopleura dioica]|uniref:Oidioi.mRNA.OKI2018_I69.PAR.g11963.t1.cds n=1 Tax=Oikopleura dioica TaxID=34765 RepID=A0ABN7RY50_OIKDI|nr:Oidioi.mRNA.OKI2018_I69.PAR.g11963.t1.cds [Oikopleura dioica]